MPDSQNQRIEYHFHQHNAAGVTVHAHRRSLSSVFTCLFRRLAGQGFPDEIGLGFLDCDVRRRGFFPSAIQNKNAPSCPSKARQKGVAAAIAFTSMLAARL
jgi:hypothetical protein